MQNIMEILKEFGLEVPEEKRTEINKRVAENYVTEAEHGKKVRKLESDRDEWQGRAENAEKTLKGFDGIDLEAMNSEVADWKRKAEQAEKDYNAKLHERDFEDALRAELDSVKFTSEAAKKAILVEVKAAGLSLKDGKILGLNDLLGQLKESDAAAFVDPEAEQLEQNRVRFTQAANKASGGGNGVTREDYKAMTLDERMKLKTDNPELYESLR